MDGGDELRAALRGRQSKEDAAAIEKEQLDRDRELFEQHEEVLLERLYEAADRTVRALANSPKAPTEQIPIEPKPRLLVGLFSPQRTVEGWNVSLGYIDEKYILCPSGTLVTPGDYQGPERYTTLREWAAEKVRRVHREGYSESLRSPWGQAFDPAEQPHYGTRAGAQAELRSRVERAKEEIITTLADLLHERGISI
jgi:hypothetical protein